MRRLTEIDFPDRMRPVMPGFASQLLFALICSLAAIGLRLMLDVWVPGVGPFVVMFPAVLVATLFGRWQAGVVTQIATTLYGWYFVLPVQHSFVFADPADVARLALASIFGLLVIALAEMFRRAVREALADRETLLRELDHRVKNNFASMASLLEMQQRRATNPETRAALQAALGRIESFALGHRFLYQDFDDVGTVNMRNYLEGLCGAIGAANGLDGNVRLRCASDQVLMPRDRAIAVGLLVNEVATNSAKHAFPDGRSGLVSVTFRRHDEGYQLDVTDDGCGMPEEKRSGSLGLALIDSLARQADAAVQRQTGSSGTSYRFALGR
jgi:two-component sensor histidine kinase